MQPTNDDWIRIRSELEQAETVLPMRKIAAWISFGCPLPPPSAYKQQLIQAHARAYGISTLVETGTYLGQMVEACLLDFSDIHSIELSQQFHERAQEKFKDQRNVTLHQGDSGEILPRILKKLRQPAIFWLDAHYSMGETAKGDLNTPIVDELTSIFGHRLKQHVVLIDDARLFNGKDDYPTVKKVQALAARTLPTHTVTNHYDIIRIRPGSSAVEII